MYFVKARKHMEEQDATNLDRIMRDRYQRSESTRLFLQALPHHSASGTASASQLSVINKDIERSVKSRSTSESSMIPSRSSDMTDETVTRSDVFRPEDLPDGAFYHPKKQVVNKPLSHGPKSGPSSYSLADARSQVHHLDTQIKDHKKKFFEFTGHAKVSRV